MSTTQLLQKLKETPHDPELHAEVARNAFRNSPIFVATVLKVYFEFEKKAESIIIIVLRRIDFLRLEKRLGSVFAIVLKYAPWLKRPALPHVKPLPEGERAQR